MDKPTKPLLGDYVHQMLTHRFKSVAKAAVGIGIPYERLKKAVQLNRFNDDDLAVLFPDSSPEELSASFEFAHSRAYVHSKRRQGEVQSEQLVGIFLQEGMTAEDIELMLENPAIARRIAGRVSAECAKVRAYLEDTPAAADTSVGARRQLLLTEIKCRLGVSSLREAAQKLRLRGTALANLTREERIATPYIIQIIQHSFPDLELSALTERGS